MDFLTETGATSCVGVRGAAAAEDGGDGEGVGEEEGGNCVDG